VVHWRLVLANMAGSRPALPAAERKRALKAIAPGQPLIVHVDEDVHFATNPRLNHVAWLLGERKDLWTAGKKEPVAKMIYDLVTPKNYRTDTEAATEEKGGSRLAELVGRYGTAGAAERNKIVKELQSRSATRKSRVAMTLAAAERALRANKQRLVKAGEVRKNANPWGRFAWAVKGVKPLSVPVHKSSPEQVRAIAREIAALKRAGEAAAGWKEPALVTMCRSPGFLPEEQSKRVEGLLLGGTADVQGRAKFVFRD